jgi:gas vesicle protein
MSGKPSVIGAAVGAVIGGAVGYFYFTETGQQRREDIARVFDRAAVELHEMRALWQRINQLGDEYKTQRREALAAGTFNVEPWGGAA